MNGYTLILVIAALVAVVFGGLAFLIPYLVKKGINIPGILNSTTSVIDTADVVLEGVRNIFPEVGALDVVDRIVDYARQAVNAAEQLYKASTIEADERKATATDIVFQCLRVAGVEITPEVEKVVNGLVEAAVFTLPKTEAMPDA